VREVRFSPPRGDALLDASARGVLSALAAPCGVRGSLASPAALTADQRAALRGEGALLATKALRTTSESSPYTRWLLLVAIGLLLGEMLLRRGQSAAHQAGATHTRNAANASGADTGRAPNRGGRAA
jgi:hypothetical protein